MPSLTDVGNPAGDALVPTPPPPTGGGGGTTGGGGSPIPGTGWGATQKNLQRQFVQRFQDPFNQKLAQVSRLAKTDPAAAQRMLAQAWSQFVTDAETFAKSSGSPFGLVVVQKAFSTPALMQTVNSLWTETGGPKTGIPSITIPPINDPNFWGLMRDITRGVLERTTPTVQPPTNNNNPQPGQPVDPNQPVKVDAPGTPAPPETGGGGSGQPGTPGAPGAPGGGGAGGAGGSGGGGGGAGGGGAPPATNTGGIDDWLKKYAPWLLTAGSVIGNLVGANSASNAAKEAAAIQAESANRATELQRQMYNKGREDQYPWLERGTAAVYRLSDLLGLKPGQQYTPSREGVGPLSLAAVGKPAQPEPAQPPLPNESQPPPNPIAAQDQQNQPNAMNLDQLAMKYRRRPQALGVA